MAPKWLFMNDTKNWSDRTTSQCRVQVGYWLIRATGSRPYYLHSEVFIGRKHSAEFRGAHVTYYLLQWYWQCRIGNGGLNSEHDDITMCMVWYVSLVITKSNERYWPSRSWFCFKRSILCFLSNIICNIMILIASSYRGSGWGQKLLICSLVLYHYWVANLKY